MTVDLLYVSDCPSHPAAARLIKDALAAAELVHRAVVEAHRREQIGSKGPVWSERPTAASKKDFIGMRLHFMRCMLGGLSQYSCIGTARLIESLRRWRMHWNGLP